MKLPALLVLCFILIAQAKVINIMPVGDSITYGCGGGCGANSSINSCDVSQQCQSGYRSYLMTMLQQQGLQINMVGPLVSGGLACAGYPGAALANISNDVSGWVEQYNPDYILLMAGTDDAYLYSSQSDAILGYLNDVITNIFTANSKVGVFVAETIPFFCDNTVSMTLINYDIGISAVVQNFANVGRTIAKVSMYSASALSYPSDYASCVHPNDYGYENIAKVWAAQTYNNN